MTYNKRDLIKTLEEIKSEKNLDINFYIDEVIEKDVPVNTLQFINLYKPINDLGVFNLIYSKRHKTPLFNNFKKGNIDNYEQVVCLGSLLTQMLCYIKTTHDDVIKHTTLIGINSVIDAIDDFVNTGSFDKINETYNNFSQLFINLFNKPKEN